MPDFRTILGQNFWHQPISFVLVGVLNTATDFVVFLLLLSITGNIVISNVVSYSCGATLSYFLNHKITFHATGARRKHTKSIALFILLTATMIVVSTLVTLGFAMFVNPAIAKLLSVVCVASLSFGGMKLIVFASGQSPGAKGISKTMTRIFRFLPAVLFSFAVLGFPFLFGIVVAEKQIFPYKHLKAGYKTGQEILRGSNQRKAYFGEFDEFATSSLDSYQSDRFVFSDDRDGQSDGYLVFGGLNQYMELCPDIGCLAVRFDGDGQVSDAVPYKIGTIFEGQIETGHEYEYVSLDAKQDIRPIGMAPLPGGDLLVTFQTTRHAGIFPFGGGVARISPDGTPVWFRFDFSHHWPSRPAENGSLLVPSTKILDQDISYKLVDGEPRVLDCDTDRPYSDLVRILSDQGAVIRDISVLESVIASPYRGTLVQTSSPCDPLHLNFIDIVGEDFPLGLSGIQPGDLILSLRNISAVAFMRPETGKIVHMLRGTFIQQHSVKHLSGSRFLMFDNLGADEVGGPSRLLEVDLAAGSETTLFPTSDVLFGDEPPFSSEAGYVSISSDRSRALVTFSYQGTAVEIDLDNQQELGRFQSLHDVSSVEGWEDSKSKPAVFQLYGVEYTKRQ